MTTTNSDTMTPNVISCTKNIYNRPKLSILNDIDFNTSASDLIIG